MAAAANRAAIQTALLSVRGLRRRRLGHVSPADYPQNGLDKWGRRRSNNGRQGNGLPSNLLAGGCGSLGGGARGRPAPRASLVLGGERAMGGSRRNSGLNGGGASNGAAAKQVANGQGGGSNGTSRPAQNGASLDQSRRYVNGTSRANGVALVGDSGSLNGIRVNGSSAAAVDSTAEESKKEGDDARKEEEGGRYSSDLVVVLDMDECLIHSQFLSDQLVDKYRQAEDRPSTASNGGSPFEQAGNHGADEAESLFLNACDSFRISLPDGDLVNVNKRPNLDIFLREITARFETYVFTAAMEVRRRGGGERETVRESVRPGNVLAERASDLLGPGRSCIFLCISPAFAF